MIVQSWFKPGQQATERMLYVLDKFGHCTLFFGSRIHFQHKKLQLMTKLSHDLIKDPFYFRCVWIAGPLKSC